MVAEEDADVEDVDAEEEDVDAEEEDVDADVAPSVERLEHYVEPRLSKLERPKELPELQQQEREEQPESLH